MKAGSKVKCVDAKNSNNWLTVGKVYTVSCVDFDDGMLVLGGLGAWNPNRFELVGGETE